MMMQDTFVRCPGAVRGNPSSRAVSIVRKASRFQSTIWIEKDGERKNAKMLLEVLGLELSTGEKVRIYASGADEEAAVKGMAELLSASEQPSRRGAGA